MDQNNTSIECKKLLSYIMSIAGDCRLMISHVMTTEEIEKYREQYQVMDDVDLEIQNVINEVGIDENSSGTLIYFLSFESNLIFFCLKNFLGFLN